MASRLCVALVLVSCAGPRAPRALRPAAPADDGVLLASWLPERADRCAITWPGRVPSRRRALVAPQSWADPDTWEPALRVTAYARADAELEDGRRALRSYFRFAGDVDAIRERAEHLPVRWEGEPCEGISCRRPVARWMDDRTIEVARHGWPRRSLPVATADCIRASRASPGAVEVGARRGTGRTVHGGLALRRAITADTDGIEIRITIPFRDVSDAEIGVEALREARPVWESLTPLRSPDRTVTRAGRVVHIRDPHPWVELELAAEDQRLRQQASAQMLSRSEPLPLDRVDVRRMAVVRHQVRLRSGELERAHGPARRRRAETLAELLARAHEAHPGEVWLAMRRARLLMDELDRPGAARELAEAVLAAELGADEPRWRSLRREAVARASPDALAAVLVEDGVADSADAPRAAADIARLTTEGVDYEWAEGAWQLGGELTGDAPTVSRTGTLSRRGALGALVALARIGARDAAGALQIAVSTEAELEPHAFGATGPELLVFRGARGGSVIVAALSTVELIEVRRLAERVDPLLGVGRATFVVQLGEPGAEPTRRRLEGAMRADGLHVRRASPALRDVSIADVERFLAGPLHDLPAALFPPPQLTVRETSPEAAARLWRLADELAPGACASAGPLLRCESPGRPQALGELLLGLARDRVLQPAP